MSAQDEINTLRAQQGVPNSIDPNFHADRLQGVWDQTETNIQATSTGFMYDDDTAATQPALSHFKFNNADPGLATEIYVSSTVLNSFDYSAVGNEIVAGDILLCNQQGATTNNFIFFVIDAPTDNTGWFTIPVASVSANGGFTDGVACNLILTTTGDRSMQTTALMVTTDNILVSNVEATPSYVTGLQLAPTPSAPKVSVDPLDGTITNITTNEFLVLDGQFGLQPDKTGGGVATIEVCSETAFDGINFSPTDFSLREQEVSTAGETFWTTPAAALLPPGAKVRFLVWNSGGGTINLVSPTANPGGNPAFGASVAITLHGRGYKV